VKEEIQNITERLQGDRIIWMVVIILFVFSMLAVYSASGSLAFKYTEWRYFALLVEASDECGWRYFVDVFCASNQL
jgi:hypothetical protein